MAEREPDENEGWRTVGSPEAQTPADYRGGVTIGLVPGGASADLPETASKMEARHAGGHDTVIVFVPEGLARDARDRIWKALGSAPRQTDRQFELEQATAYENNISRMYEGT